MAESAVGDSWAVRFGLGDHELVSFVGAGGKTTLMLAIGRELSQAGHRVVITTTTRMSVDEVDPPVVDSIRAVEANLNRRPGPLFVAKPAPESKVTGPTPAEINALFRESSAHYVLVEADGAQGRSLKAPADFEPVIPSASTIVALVAGADAIGASIATACHRPERVAKLLNRPVTHQLEVSDVAKVLTSAAGGLKDVPAAARVVVAVTKVTSGNIEAARQLSLLVAKDPDVERVLVVPYR